MLKTTAISASVPARIAYLIIGYNQPRHLARLLQSLAHPNDHFFIHIDRKQDETPFRDALEDIPNVHWIEHRNQLYWGSISFVKTQLLLLEQATASGGGFQQYVFLSGSEYPIKPLPYIRDFLLKSEVTFVPIHGELPPDHPMSSRFLTYHFIDNPYLNERGAKANSWLARKIRIWLAKHPIPRKRPAHQKFYQSSTWVSLHHSFAVYVLQKVAEEPDVLNQYDYTFCAEEMFMATLLKTSPLRHTAYYDYAANTKGKYWLGIFYIDWQTPNVPLPKVMDDTDLDVLTNAHPHALFARKFDEKRSAALLDQLDTYVVQELQQ